MSESREGNGFVGFSANSRAAAIRKAKELMGELRHEVDAALGQNLQLFEKEPCWGLLYRMYQRAADHADACVLLTINERYAAAEVLCRTLVESALNLFYCSIGDSVGTILLYFKSHIATERKQNKSWGASVDGAEMPLWAKEVHMKRIETKEAALASRESILDHAFDQIGHSYSESLSIWPSIYDRFKAIGKEVDYRTTYAALCSQAHNDPEDLMNDFVSQLTDTKESQLAENQTFSVFMVLVSIGFLIEATMMYLAKFIAPGNEMKGLWTAAQRVAFDMMGESHSVKS